ncbi:SDR family oxidoreductase [Paludisphaera rhizosphaerae]|uniref:SDR family oxidoreductase n=1 Tax=Paludisphaera rhizosphaerae TaxID=2711216 RepID=UPI0013EA9F57|nr:SDR family oxidoreductase [Paludisphaera rhizosphaerae]
MQITGNTILITGGGSGIGRALAEAFHARGNQVVVAGRRAEVLDEVVAANPGMKALTLDVDDGDAIKGFAERAVREFPSLNVLLNNAGIMKLEQLTSSPGDLDDAEKTVVTNLLGPIRLTAALLPHLMKQPRSAVMNVTSGLAFVPLAIFPTYCATKAALHSYTMSLRRQLQGTSVEAIEIAPPYVQTHLTGDHQANDPRAMPLDEYIAEVMSILERDPAVAEVVVERCKPLRFAAENGKLAEMFEALNSQAF